MIFFILCPLLFSIPINYIFKKYRIKRSISSYLFLTLIPLCENDLIKFNLSLLSFSSSLCHCVCGLYLYILDQNAIILCCLYNLEFLYFKKTILILLANIIFNIKFNTTLITKSIYLISAIYSIEYNNYSIIPLVYSLYYYFNTDIVNSRLIYQYNWHFFQTIYLYMVINKNIFQIFLLYYLMFLFYHYYHLFQNLIPLYPNF